MTQVNRRFISDIPFTLEHVTDLGLGDEMVIAFEPVVSVLANVGRVVSGFNGTDVVDHSKKRIPVEEKVIRQATSFAERLL